MSIIVPCFNEQDNIPLLLDRFQRVIRRKDVELILVNNGSTDHSAEILEKLLPNYSFARSVLVRENRGYGFGILRGLQAAKGEFLGWTHADLQTDPADLIRALEIIEANGNRNTLFVKGTRCGRSLFDNFFTAGMSIFETLYLGECLNEINAQPNVFSRKFYESWRNPPFDFSLDLYALYLARKRHLEIHRFPVQFPKRLYGQSKWNTGIVSKWKFIKRTIAFSKNLKERGIQ